MSRQRRQDGFTLLELMIGLVLMGLLLLLLFGAFRLGSRAWDAVEADLAESTTQSVLTGVLRSTLEQAAPVHFKTQDGLILAFLGESGAIHYVGRLPGRERVPGLHMLALARVEDRLELRWLPFGGQAEDFSALADVEPRVLLEGVTAFELAYLQPGSEGSAAAWVGEWSSHEAFPAMVRVSLATESGGKWIELVAYPRLFADGCPWDAQKRRCRDGDATGTGRSSS